MAGRLPTTYHYDPRGLLDQLTLPGGVVSTSAGQAGSASGRQYTFQYDDAHRLIGMGSASGESVSYTLDNSGNVTREEWKNADGSTAQVVRREFDALNRLWKHIRQINGQDAVTQFGYDAQGNPTTTQRPQVAAYGEATPPTDTRRYNALDQLTAIEDAINGSAKPTSITPKANDDTQALTAPNGAGCTYQRDGFGQALTASSDAGSSTQAYDAAGNLVSRTDALGVSLSASYDALNRVKALKFTPAGSTTPGTSPDDISYTWDASPAGAPLACSHGVGRVCQIVDAGGTTYMAYDAFGNLTSQTQGLSSQQLPSQWGYDGEDRLSASVGLSAKTVALSRDAEGRPSQVLGLLNGAAATVVASTSYQATGEADSTKYGNQRVFDRDFDMSGLIAGAKVSSASTATTDGDAPLPGWALLSLGAGLMGVVRRRARATKAIHSSVLTTALCLLPTLGLLTAILPGNAQAQTPTSTTTETYTHDARGNVQSLSRDGQANSFQYDKLDRIKAETGSTNQSIGYDPNGNRTSDASGSYTLLTNSNRLATRNSQPVSYDAAGNTVSETVKLNGQMVTRSYGYNLAGQLKTVSINGQVQAAYLYNHKGLRVRKTLTNPPANTPAITIYEYNPNNQLLEEIAGSGSNFGKTLATYVWKDDIPAAIIFAPNTPSNPSPTQEKIVYLETDQLNTPRKATDQSGKVVWTWNSDAFGSTPPNEDPDGDGQKTTE